MGPLRAELVRQLDPEFDLTAEIDIIEPNGDRHRLKCSIDGDLTRISGDGENIDYLNLRYGEPVVCFTARSAVTGQP